MWGQRGFIGYNYRPGPLAVGGRIPSQTTPERLPSPRISAQEGILNKNLQKRGTICHQLQADEFLVTDLSLNEKCSSKRFNLKV